ncbi:MAG: Rieske (2Fe-2S) protein [Gemmatimonadaceae bacterium]|nr:Rieske (2Fe-2S) protein [Gemmatimonadaceae bacterium]
MSDRACGGCEIAGAIDRRRFVRAGVTALALLGVTASAAEALPTLFVAALGGARESKRYAILSADGVSIDKEMEVILVRWKGAMYAFALSCPHQNTALKWIDGSGRFQCPKHKSRYQPDGTFIDGRATRGMDRFAIKRVGNEIEVDLESLLQEDLAPDQWKAAVVKLS